MSLESVFPCRTLSWSVGCSARMDCQELGVTQTGSVGVRAVQVRECPSHNHSKSFPDCPASFHPLFSSCLAYNAGPDSVSPCGFAVLLPQRLGVCGETPAKEPRGGEGGTSQSSPCWF